MYNWIQSVCIRLIIFNKTESEIHTHAAIFFSNLKIYNHKSRKNMENNYI